MFLTGKNASHRYSQQELIGISYCRLPSFSFIWPCVLSEGNSEIFCVAAIKLASEQLYCKSKSKSKWHCLWYLWGGMANQMTWKRKMNPSRVLHHKYKRKQHIPVLWAQQYVELVSLSDDSEWLDSAHPSPLILQCSSDKAGLWGQCSSLQSLWSPDSEQHYIPTGRRNSRRTSDQESSLQTDITFSYLTSVRILICCQHRRTVAGCEQEWEAHGERPWRCRGTARSIESFLQICVPTFLQVWIYIAKHRKLYMVNLCGWLHTRYISIQILNISLRLNFGMT